MIAYRGISRAALAVLAVAALNACSNPVGDRDDHVTPTSLRIQEDGAEIVVASRAGAQGRVTIVGAQSGVITVTYFDAKGQPINPGTEYHLQVESADPSIAQWLPQQPGAFTGTISGRGLGSTTLTFQWVHGPVGTGHSEIDINVPVTVSADTPI